MNYQLWEITRKVVKNEVGIHGFQLIDDFTPVACNICKSSENEV